MFISYNLLLFAESASSGDSSEKMVAIFLIEIGLMLLFGRILGEIMQRLGQPAVMGQLIAGVVVGPSVFGKFLPGLYAHVFPNVVAQTRMIDAISQLGILLLLVLTGIETDLNLVTKMKKTAFFASISGILLPFVCGYILGEFLPASMVPDPGRRLVTSLFLATALSISSVKIVAMVIMEVGFLRRNVGQIILASAILDDTIGWIIIAIIGGIASGGAVDFKGAGLAFLGTIVFLAVSLTVGRRLITHLIRWTNDNLVSEMPVITAILVLMIALSLLTDVIGVHTVLGAFVVGILVGQSPILTEHIEEQLRGMIVAFFAPIFFAVAGREIDLSVLGDLHQIGYALILIVIASFGKVAGCFTGGRIGGLANRESIALALGMNARGSTEVIVATIGLSLGVLNRDLFTLIVVMAITTTLATPPLLRWALKRIPPTGEEKERLEREEAQKKEFVPSIERILVASDHSRNGTFASTLAGLFAGTRKVMMTVLDIAPDTEKRSEAKSKKAVETVKRSVKAAATSETQKEDGVEEPPQPIVVTGSADSFLDDVQKELEKGYNMLFIGADGVLDPKKDKSAVDQDAVATLLSEYDGVAAILVANGRRGPESMKKKMKILVPSTGTDYSQRASEIAIALARAVDGSVTALHYAPPVAETSVLRRSSDVRAAGRNAVREIGDLGKREKVAVHTSVRTSNAPDMAILRQIKRGKPDLVVVGAKLRPGKHLYFGKSVEVLVEKAPCPVLVVGS